MQSKEVLNRLDNPPIIDERDKPIDLGDMPDDMDTELVKIAIYGIVEAVLISYQDDDIHKKSIRHNIANAIFKEIVNEQFGLKLSTSLKNIEKTTADEYNEKWLKEKSAYLASKVPLRKYFAEHGLYYINDIREAIDITIGDDGFRGKEIIEVLKIDVKERSDNE